MSCKKKISMADNNPDLLVNIGITAADKTQARTTDFCTDRMPGYTGQCDYSWKSEKGVKRH